MLGEEKLDIFQWLFFILEISVFSFARREKIFLEKFKIHHKYTKMYSTDIQYDDDDDDKNWNHLIWIVEEEIF